MEVNSCVYLQQGKYPPTSPTLRWMTIIVYATQIPKKLVYFSRYTKNLDINLTLDVRFCLFSCSEVNSTCYSLLSWLINTHEKLLISDIKEMLQKSSTECVPSDRRSSFDSLWSFCLRQMAVRNLCQKEYFGYLWQEKYQQNSRCVWWIFIGYWIATFLKETL